jgi:hypothetical protein
MAGGPQCERFLPFVASRRFAGLGLDHHTGRGDAQQASHLDELRA